MVINAGGSTPRNNSESDLINYESGVLLNVNSLKFQIYSTYHCRVRIRSISMGWDFITPDEPAYPSNGPGGSSYTTPTIGITQDIDDLEIILYS
jgi:hypothetical protein